MPIAVDDDTYHELVSLYEEDPETQVTVDLAQQTIMLPGGRRIGFPIDGFAKHCLLNGVDQMGFLMQQEDAIAAYESTAIALDTHAGR